jgi:type I restriction system adenine methylase HsdM
MALKKSELYSSLWKSCDELRGGMDASQYKDYVLVLLFVKYVSDKHGGRANALIEVPAGGSYADLMALKNSKEIGEGINIAITRLAEANELGSLFGSVDFNDEDKLGKGREMVDRLTKLVGIFEGLDFRRNRADGDDLLGDAYEYLMRNFATESGKSKGQFYTPAEVSRILARVIGVGRASSPDQTIHDPTCGSGSLLLKAHDEAKGATGLDLALYGQEMDNATSALAKMNMILHDCPAAAHDIFQGNTLSSPHFVEKDGTLKRFDFVVANPPFSTKAWSSGILPAYDTWERFKDGIPPEKNGDFAFLLHILGCLKSTGKGGVILPHGVLFRGNAEAVIRRNIVRRGYLRAIIGLPANLFFGTGIPACILVVDKEDAAARKGIFMIDASKGFIKDGNKNRLREQDIHRIVDTYGRLLEVPGYSRMVPLAEIADPKNDYNLNLPRYIDSSEPEDLQDLTAHLRGGIPERDVEALAAYWEVFPTIRATLFSEVVASTVALPPGMYPEYAETHFQPLEPWEDCPDEFAIITAYATTGEKWTAAQNEAADRKLEARLRKLSLWVRRITGYSPATGHAEPGWAVPLSFDAACDIGDEFKQDAIYLVSKDTLAVSHCDSRRKRIEIGPFAARVHTSASRPVVRPGYCQLRVPAAGIKPVIFAHPEFTAFKDAVTRRFTAWRTSNTRHMTDFDIGGRPKALIEALSEDLLSTFHQAPLLDPYDVYQHLMDYWAVTMQDDCHLIAGDGWHAAAQPELLVEDKTRKSKPDLVQGRRKYQCELIPPALLIVRYFAAEQAAIDELGAAVAALAQQLEELAEEHGGEGGLLEDAANDKGKITKASVTARLKAIKANADAADERTALKEYLGLIEQEVIASAKLKAAQDDLVAKLLAKYAALTVAEIKSLVVEDKWLAAIAAEIQGELDRVSQTLTGRIRQLAERYDTPLPQVANEVERIATRVDEHLERMGVSWT